MVFHWGLSDNKSPQVSGTRLGIQAVLSNAVICIISTRPPTSKSSRTFNIPLLIGHNAPITIGTRYFHVPQLFQFSSKVEVLILLFTFLQIYSVVRRDSKVNNFADSLFFFVVVDYYYLQVFYISSNWCFLLESEWYQVFSVHQDSSKYPSQF